MTEPSFVPGDDRSRQFKPLEQADFLTLEHAPYLKGLLRPFKGKGQLTTWASQSERLRDGLIRLAERRVLAQTVTYPFRALRVELAQQTTSAGTTFLRWRNVDRSAMGVSLWEDLIAHSRTPASLVPQLLGIELQRITLNMQISLTHAICRQAAACAEKMAHAEAAYRRRVRPTTTTSTQETP